MNEKNTNNLTLFLAYVDKTITEEQYNELSQWLKESSENEKLFFDYLHLYKKSRSIGLTQSINKENAWSKLLNNVNRPVNTKVELNSSPSTVRYLKPKFNFFKYAAIFIGIIGVAYFMNTSIFNKNENDLVNTEEDIILKLDNGKTKIISSEGIEKVVNSKGEVIGTKKGNLLNYSTNNSNSEKLVFNELTVPYGKLFDLVLSDGTKIKLNAGTSIKYPVKFIKGKERKVFLEGEAYFDVSKDTQHPFIVNVNELNVRVLGTQFNISSYPEDKEIKTVLVEGSVSLYAKDEIYDIQKATVLKPNFKADWSKTNKNMTIEEVDTNIYTGWIAGKLIFKNTQFKSIILKLERRYNITIINNNKSLSEQYFDATFDIETIEQVLESFNKSFAIEYKIENNNIIIN